LVHYPLAPHEQDAYKEYSSLKGSLPLTEKVHSEVLSLPISPFLKEEAVAKAVSACRTALS